MSVRGYSRRWNGNNTVCYFQMGMQRLRDWQSVLRPRSHCPLSSSLSSSMKRKLLLCQQLFVLHLVKKNLVCWRGWKMDNSVSGDVVSFVFLQLPALLITWASVWILFIRLTQFSSSWRSQVQKQLARWFALIASQARASATRRADNLRAV